MTNTEGIAWQIETNDLATDIARAAAVHLRRLGTRPTICYVNIEQMPDADTVAGLEIVGAKNQLRGSIWVAAK